MAALCRHNERVNISNVSATPFLRNSLAVSSPAAKAPEKQECTPCQDLVSIGEQKR